MLDPPAATYSPVADPRDPTSLPVGLAAHDEVLVPLRPRRRGTRWAPPWIRHANERHRLVTHFCYADRVLLRWDERPGAAEAAVRHARPWAALTLDVPFYGFMTSAQRLRALARSLAAMHRGLRTWEPEGIRTIPLVKGLDPGDWKPQLEAARDLGVHRVAFYAREALLERTPERLHRFVREAHRHARRPLLLGCSTPLGPVTPRFDAAAAHHYVLARRGLILTRAAQPRPLEAGTYSPLLGRFLTPRDAPGLVAHNFRRVRERFNPRATLARFGLQDT